MYHLFAKMRDGNGKLRWVWMGSFRPSSLWSYTRNVAVEWYGAENVKYRFTLMNKPWR